MDASSSAASTWAEESQFDDSEAEMEMLMFTGLKVDALLPVTSVATNVTSMLQEHCNVSTLISAINPPTHNTLEHAVGVEHKVP